MNVFIGIVLVLGVMILVHEWGHYFLARLCGVRVEVFSIGFGPRLFGWKRGATDFRVSALPLGGYVRMAGQDLSDVDRGGATPSGAPDELMSKPRWQRALIAFGGPAVNLILPVILLTGFFLVRGLPHSASLEQPIQVTVFPARPAQQPGGLRLGDRILTLNGVRNPTWENAYEILGKGKTGTAVRVEAENNGERRNVEVTIPDTAHVQRIFGYAPLPALIDEVAVGLPAYRAGLQPEDRIVAVDGQKIQMWGQFVDAIKQSGGKTVRLDVQRKGQPTTIDVTPQQGLNERGESVWQIGVLGSDETVFRRGSVIDSVKYAGLKTAADVEQIIGVVGKLFTGRVSVTQLQGVVGIARVSGEAVKRGPSQVILLMALISVNLGILNLLPIPILDGGQILLLSIEGLRRRDLSLAFKERFVQVGFVFLLVLFAIVMYNDVARILPTH